jgi:periplasmic copper chaperone A
MKRLIVAPAVAAAALVVFAPAASAHVTVDPSSAPKGGEITLGFRVPNEMSNADTVKVQIFFPTTNPILGVDPESIRGWQDTVITQHLTTPIQTDDGPVSDVVSEIDWSGGPIAVGHFNEFYVLAQSLPTNTNSLVFKALQTYSNGDIVRWIDPVTPGQPDPPHPTPILYLTGPLTAASQAAVADESAPASAAASPVVSVAASSASAASVRSAKEVGVIGVVVGALGLLAAIGSIVFTRRRAAPATPPGPDSG